MGYDELEMRRRQRRRRMERIKKQKRKRTLVLLAFGIVLAAIICGAVWGISLLFNRKQVALRSVAAPDWIQQDFFDVNPYSRPGTEMFRVNGIVIHYVANPGTSAKQNWNYFNNLANQTGERKTSASSHFIIGLDGEILQGIPISEMAYATSKEKNVDTISIELCHPDETGKFTDDTYASLVKLTAWLCDTLGLSEKDVIRHYDATGKDCPRYFVSNEDAWNGFRKDVKKAVKQIKKDSAE